MRRVFEPHPGSSFARNRAVDETAADYIFFIDDDAIAERDWAVELLDAMRRRDLDAACGMVMPRWSSPPPDWLGPSLWVKLAVHDRRAIEAAPLASAERLDNYFSANVGFKRSAFARFGKFREDLGVVGGNPISGEDTELFARILARGGAMGFAPRAHRASSDPARADDASRICAARASPSAWAPDLPGCQSHNRLDKLVRNGVRMAAAAMRGDSERAIYHELECANFFGYWRGRLIAR